MSSQMYHEFMDENSKALKRLKEMNIEIKDFPSEIIESAKKALIEVVEDQSRKSADFKCVFDSMQEYYKQIKPWSDISEGKYLSIR